jgi:hypothetical protein
MTVAVGTNSRNSSSRFGPSSTDKMPTPVRLPPGRLRLETRPSRTGSPAVRNTIGIVAVAALATGAARVFAVITDTCRRTRSAASVGKRS